MDGQAADPVGTLDSTSLTEASGASNARQWA